MATVPTVTVDDPHAPPASPAHGGDGHHGDVPMMVGHDGQMHPSNLQHFFVSSEQQFEASKLGMWLFLATELLLFGGMFVAYGIFRVQYPELFEAASLQLDTVLGAANTLVLLLSSLTMAWAIRGAQMDNRKVLIGNLVATIALASFFLGVKYFEYSHNSTRASTRASTSSCAATRRPCRSWTASRRRRRCSRRAPTTRCTTPRPSSRTRAPWSRPRGRSPARTRRRHRAAPPASRSTRPGPGRRTFPPDRRRSLAAGPERGGAGIGGAVERAAQGEAQRAALATGAADQSAAGLETEHGDVDRAEAKEAIFHDRRAGIFFSIYYMITGVHAIHIIIGIIAIGFLTVFSAKGKYSSVWYTPVENVGLYWHIVDIIWIFAFPLLYLI